MSDEFISDRSIEIEPAAADVLELIKDSGILTTRLGPSPNTATDGHAALIQFFQLTTQIGGRFNSQQDAMLRLAQCCAELAEGPYTCRVNL